MGQMPEAQNFLIPPRTCSDTGNCCTDMKMVKFYTILHVIPIYTANMLTTVFIIWAQQPITIPTVANMDELKSGFVVKYQNAE